MNDSPDSPETFPRQNSSTPGRANPGAGPLASIYDSGSPPQPPEKKEPAADAEPEDELGARMTFLEHLDELRRRILFSLYAVIVTFGVSWFFREAIFGFLAQPVLDTVGELHVTKPTEPFTIYLKVSFIAAIFMAVPWILTQVWLFIAPGLYRREKNYFLPFLLFSSTLFVLGGAFAYYVVLPPALHFLLIEFGKEFTPIITAVEFFDFELLILLGMGVIFQMPVLVAFLSIFGLVTPRFLWKNFRYALLGIVIVAAVVSPTTDPFNLVVWSGPMLALYLVSIGIAWIFKRRRKRREVESTTA